jgi:hypothetical protein
MPVDFLPRQDEDGHAANYLQYEHVIAITRNRTFEEMEKVIDEIFEGGSAETGINLSNSGNLPWVLVEKHSWDGSIC